MHVLLFERRQSCVVLHFGIGSGFTSRDYILIKSFTLFARKKKKKLVFLPHAYCSPFYFAQLRNKVLEYDGYDEPFGLNLPKKETNNARIRSILLSRLPKLSNPQRHREEKSYIIWRRRLNEMGVAKNNIRIYARRKKRVVLLQVLNFDSRQATPPSAAYRLFIKTLSLDLAKLPLHLHLSSSNVCCSAY